MIVRLSELKSAVGLIIPTDKALIALEQCKAIIPPNYSRCIQVSSVFLLDLVDTNGGSLWQYGFPDESLRIMSVDSDKVKHGRGLFQSFMLRL